MLRLFVIALLLGSAIQAKDRVPVIVELFTSEGCSSCPPADELLAELERDQPVANVDLIVLSEHVDYWNSQGWKDPFSAAMFSARQQSYATTLHSSDVYTPQAVIDGRTSAVGSNRQGVLRAITVSGQTAKPQLEVNVVREGNTIVVDMPATAKGDVWIALTEAQTTSHVTHGENSGRTLHHVGVVRVLTRLSAGKARITLDRNWGSDLRLVTFVQDGHSGRILQAVQKTI